MEAWLERHLAAWLDAAIADVSCPERDLAERLIAGLIDREPGRIDRGDTWPQIYRDAVAEVEEPGRIAEEVAASRKAAIDLANRVAVRDADRAERKRQERKRDRQLRKAGTL